MQSDLITFVMFTYNEEARVVRAIRNFSAFGHVLVVDNVSTDRTQSLAKEEGAEVLEHRNPGWVEDSGTVSVVKAAVRTPWIYWAYADEMVDRSTIEAILDAIRSEDCSIVRIARKNYYYGSFCHEAYANELNRVFRRDAIDFADNEIHHFGKPTVDESKIKLLDPSRHFVHHFISNTAKSYLRTIDTYTDIESKRTKPRSAFYFGLHLVKSFVGNYLVRGGYKAGMPGFFLSVQMIYYEALLNMKSFESTQGFNTASIEAKNNTVRDALLRGLH